ncbi:PaaX family transcriptional regulator, partial [Burkholderia multivorans]
VMENPLLPVDLVGEEQPSQRFRAVMDRCNLEYYLRYGQQVREAAAESPSYDLVDWLPEG